MIKPTILDATGVTDPVGMLLTCLVGILGLFGVPALLNWDASMVMAFLGFLGMGASAARAIYKAAQSGAMVPEGEMPALPKGE